ncbi:hypothetical protein V6N12_056085 [Hibiscus sabdariffa]|uniref:Uncharacterized protein n=1 Tax=Hibiscus sabdariffa TaxID=183260 RepID=A0ABR2CS41_9ROSI
MVPRKQLSLYAFGPTGCPRLLIWTNIRSPSVRSSKKRQRVGPLPLLFFVNGCSRLSGVSSGWDLSWPKCS